MSCTAAQVRWACIYLGGGLSAGARAAVCSYSCTTFSAPSTLCSEYGRRSLIKDRVHHVLPCSPLRRAVRPAKMPGRTRAGFAMVILSSSKQIKQRQHGTFAHFTYINDCLKQHNTCIDEWHRASAGKSEYMGIGACRGARNEV